MRLLILLIAALLVSCAAPQEIPVERMLQGSSSGHDHKRSYAVRDMAQWQALWEEHTRRMNPVLLPELDFSQEMVLAAFLGNQLTGGYTVEIAGVTVHADHLEARVAERMPGRECMVTQAESQPFDIVRIPLSPKEVRFVVEEQVRECG